MRNATSGIVAAVFAVVCLAGCQQPQRETQTPNEKQARLLAAQSADLQQQLAAYQAQIESLRQKHAQELGQRDEELARCKARIEALQKDIEKGIAERVSGVTTKLLEENAKLRQEVERLNAQIEKAKVP
jgi:outer membrane murein-binding lipoprotein Lpp